MYMLQYMKAIFMFLKYIFVQTVFTVMRIVHSHRPSHSVISISDAIDIYRFWWRQKKLLLIWESDD